MADYTFTSPKWEGDIKFSFYENGFLKAVEIPEVIDRKSLEFFSTHFPVHESQLEFFRQNTSVKITKVAIDITFDAFWEAYNKKSGSKELARMYWDGVKKTINKRPLTDSERVEIMSIAKKYSLRYQGNKKEFQPLASSFLNGRMWEAELEGYSRKNEINLLHLFPKKIQNNG